MNIFIVLETGCKKYGHMKNKEKDVSCVIKNLLKANDTKEVSKLLFEKDAFLGNSSVLNPKIVY